MRRSRLLTSVAVLLILFIYLPLIVVVLYGFNSRLQPELAAAWSLAPLVPTDLR